MKIAVTAASGQLGSAIVKATSQLAGVDNVIAVARTPEKAKALGVEVRPGSYDDRSALAQAFAGIDTVLLVSGMDAPERRIIQHRNVIAAATAAGVRKMVYTSVQGPAVNSAFAPIVQSNRQTEVDLKASGMDWAIGRNGIYIEPDVEYIGKYISPGRDRQLRRRWVVWVHDQTRTGLRLCVHADPATTQRPHLQPPRREDHAGHTGPIPG